MANLYDKAGLVNIPVGYQEGFLYNIKPEDNTLGFRFNRDSAATRVNKEGLIEQVGYFGPELVQNGNFSELGSELVVNGDFATDSNWNLVGSTISISDGKLNFVNAITNTEFAQQSIVAPIGKVYKITLEVSNLSGGDSIKIRYPFQDISINTNGTHTLYGVGVTANFFRITPNSTTATFSIDNVSVKQVDPNNYWNLGTGWSIGDGKAIKTPGTGSSLSQTIPTTTVGKKYKFTFDAIVTSGVINATIYGFTIPVFSTSGSQEHTITATLTSGFQFYGAANFDGSITNISVVEVLGDKPRIDYTDSLTSPSFLLEPQSTNLLEFSKDFSKWAKQSGGTGSAPIITSNSAISPDGTQNADKVIFNKGTGTTTSDLSILQASFTSQSNTASIYIKADSSQRIVIRNSSNWVGYDVGTEWTRIEKTDTGGSIQIGLRDGYGVANVPDTATVYLWGAQVEALIYATSYIPTAGSTVTRAQETCIGAGSASTFNSTEGVLYAEVSYLIDTGSYRTISINDGTNDNIVAFENRPNSNQIKAFINVSGIQVMSSTQTLTNVKEFNKIAIKWKQNDSAWWVNGVKIHEDLSFTTFGNGVLNKLNFNNGVENFPFEGKTKGIYVFNEALTDDELQQLTGPEYNSFAALAAAYNYTVI